MKKIKRIPPKLERIRNLTGAEMARAAAGVVCTQSCNQCTLYPECSGDTSTTTFQPLPVQHPNTRIARPNHRA